MYPIRRISRFQVWEVLPPAIANNRSPYFLVPKSKRSKPLKKPGLAANINTPAHEPSNHRDKVQSVQLQPAVALIEEGKMALVKPVEITLKPVVLPPDQPKGTNPQMAKGKAKEGADHTHGSWPSGFVKSKASHGPSRIFLGAGAHPKHRAAVGNLG